MPLPSKAQQVKAVMKFLDSERIEGRSLEEIATEIVNGFWGVVAPNAPLSLREGMLIKAPLANKVHRVAWMDAARVWIVPETGGYGWLGPVDTQFWTCSEEYRPKRRIEVDGKGKMVEMTDEEIDRAWTCPDWKVGSQVSQRQRQFVFEVLATGPATVLLRSLKTGELTVDSIKNLEQYYKREVKGAAEW